MDVKVRKYRIQDIKPGMIMGKSILSARGDVVIEAGTILTADMISRIVSLGLGMVSVVDDADEEIGARQKREVARTNFVCHYSKAVKDTQQIFDEARTHRNIMMEEMNEVTNYIIDYLIGMRGVLYLLNYIHHYDDPSFQHSVNVAVLAGIIGKWLEFDEQNLRELVFAGLAHDIGKSQIPLPILNKPDKLLHHEMETVKRHAIAGYDLLRKAGSVSDVILNAARQHHERIDGSGYPQGLKGEQIPLESRIIAVADIYDAITSSRTHRMNASPFAAVKELSNSMFDKLDVGICKLFSEHLQDHLVGCIVKLSDGRTAKVIFLDKNRTNMPIVETEDKQYIDLCRNKNIDIASIVTI